MNAQAKTAPQKKRSAAVGSARVGAADLVKALRFASAAIERKTSIPVLSTVHLDFQRGRLTIKGTDLDLECEMRVDAECGEPFKICVGPKALGALVRCDPVGLVDVSVADGMLHVVAGDVQATFRTLFPSEDYPFWVAAKNDAVTGSGAISETRLVQMLDDVAPCISTEETRYYLNGIFFHSKEDGMLRAVATDGHRLALRKTTDIPWVGLDGIVPEKAAKIIRAAISDKGNREITVRGDDRQWEIEPNTGEWIVRTKMIDGAYPDYLRVIPTGDAKMSVPLSFAQLRRLTCIPGGDYAVGVKFEPDAGIMTAQSVIDGISVIAPLPGGKGEGFGMNLKYAVQMLRRHGVAVLQSTGKGDPVKFVTEDPDLTLMVMPMRV